MPPKLSLLADLPKTSNTFLWLQAAVITAARLGGEEKEEVEEEEEENFDDEDLEEVGAKQKRKKVTRSVCKPKSVPTSRQGSPLRGRTSVSVPTSPLADWSLDEPSITFTPPPSPLPPRIEVTAPATARSDGFGLRPPPPQSSSPVVLSDLGGFFGFSTLPQAPGSRTAILQAQTREFNLARTTGHCNSFPLPSYTTTNSVLRPPSMLQLLQDAEMRETTSSTQLEPNRKSKGGGTQNKNIQREKRNK